MVALGSWSGWITDPSRPVAHLAALAAYVLAAMHLRRTQSQEAGMKYFVLGAFSSAFFLYGIALVYGSTGSTNLSRIAAFSPGAGR